MRCLAALTLLLSLCTNLHAHHSFSAEFDSEKRTTITGTVTEVRFRNPHVQYFLDVDADGETQAWIVAAQNMTIMRRNKVSASTVGVGDEITVGGYAGRDGAHKVYLDTLILADGTRFSMYGDTALRRALATTNRVEESSASALVEALQGDWAFDVDKPMVGAPLHLRFAGNGDGLRAVLDNEELDVTTGEDSFSITLDRENRAGFPVKLLLTGRLRDGSIDGTIEMVAGYTNFPELDARRFSAVRASADQWAPKPLQPPAPFEISGAWERVPEVLGPIGRTNPQLSEAGKARLAEYRKGAYDPVLRCLESGPLRRYARRGNVEFIPSQGRLTMIYSNGNNVRRFWFDRSKHTEGRAHDLMGESIAHWDGATLVIDTRHLAEAVLTHNSEPVSENARLLERFRLDDDGYLITEITLEDPTYYERPVVRRLKWQRSDDVEMLYDPCDPDSFYRGLHFDGELDSYFENQPE
jgi:hypothetical protein